MSKLLNAVRSMPFSAKTKVEYYGYYGGAHGRSDAVMVSSPCFYAMADEDGEGAGWIIREDIIRSKKELAKFRKELLYWHG